MVTKRSDTIDYLSSVQGHSRNDILMEMGGHFSTHFPGKQVFEWLKYIHGILNLS